jgi:hypothetical protein
MAETKFNAGQVPPASYDLEAGLNTFIDGLSTQESPLPSPSLVFIQEMGTGIIISGAGLSSANGLWGQAGVFNGRPTYGVFGLWQMLWHSASYNAWIIYSTNSAPIVPRYVLYEDVATPDLGTIPWIPLSSVLVSGVSPNTGAVNDTYVPGSQPFNGKLYYQTASGNSIYYNGTNWLINEQNDTGEDVFISNSTGDATPDLASGWTYIGSNSNSVLPTVSVISGIAPAPTVTAEGPVYKQADLSALISPTPILTQTALPQVSKISDTTPENVCGPFTLLADHCYRVTVRAKAIENGGGNFIQLLSANFGSWVNSSGHFRAYQAGAPSSSTMIGDVDYTGVIGFYGTAPFSFTYYVVIDAVIQANAGPSDLLYLAYSEIVSEPSGSYLSDVVMTVQDLGTGLF